MARRAAICGSVRQVLVSLSAHLSFSGSNRHRRGSLISPSTKPSSLSQSARTAAAIAGVLAAGIIPPGLDSAWAFQTKPVKRPVQLYAGAPAMMPS